MFYWCNNIYAAGDCASDLMLAHFASYQGVTAVENMFLREKKSVRNALVPAGIFTDPEIASVGLSQAQALKLGLAVKINKIDFRASAMARITDESDGFIKLMSDEQSGRIIGGAIIGPRATELIATVTLAIAAHFKLGQLREMIFTHPTLSESLQQAVILK